MPTMIAAAPSTARILPGSENTIDSCGSCDPMAKATSTPKNIATPPSLGVGRVCTSRSRIFGYSRYLVLSFQMSMASAKVTTAATPATRT